MAVPVEPLNLHRLSVPQLERLLEDARAFNFPGRVGRVWGLRGQVRRQGSGHNQPDCAGLGCGPGICVSYTDIKRELAKRSK